QARGCARHSSCPCGRRTDSCGCARGGTCGESAGPARRAYPARSRRSGAEYLATTHAARLEDAAAGLGLHAGAETMHLGSLTRFGLESTLHGEQLLRSNNMSYAFARMKAAREKRTFPIYSLYSIVETRLAVKANRMKFPRPGLPFRAFIPYNGKRRRWAWR